MTSTDTAIVGAGPIGIELAVALKRHGIPHLHFDGKQVGQTMFWWPPGTRWFSSNDRISIAGVPLQTTDQSKATREDYLRYLRSVVEQFDLQVNTYEPVKAIERDDEGFTLHTHAMAGNRRYRARRVVLATGGTAAPRLLRVPGEDLPHVSHYLADPHMYFRRRVLIVGGRNSAVEAALRCHQVGAQVILSYRRGEFDARSIKYWLYPEITGLIKSRRIEAYFNTMVKRIAPGEATLSRCTGQGLRTTDEEIAVEADFVLLLVGYLADMSLFRAAGVEFSGPNEAPVFDERTMETTVPGLYVAGTAIAGTQQHYRVFLENCHVHVDRIIAAITGAPPPLSAPSLEQPET